jgi:4-hydroxy-3-methylbut-2-enyl diphosphate reductase
MSRLLLLAPMGIEARAVARGAPEACVKRTGMGPRRARRAVARLAGGEARAVAIAGFAGALSGELKPGDVVVASELRLRDGTTVADCPGADVIAGMLRRAGLTAHVGPLVSVRAPAIGPARARLGQSRAIAVDMESAWLAAVAGDRPLVVARVILDAPGHRLPALRGATTTLTATAGVLERWGQAVGPRQLVLAAPRASCAGVERAIEAVERALEQFGPPVYMRKQIVHNRHVVVELEQRGAICVDDLEQVPPGSTVVFSAHGVSPAVRQQAQARQLNVIDATCPLVSKVHGEARRFAQRDFTIVLVGHEGHEEVEGTYGEVPDRMRVIASEDEVDALDVANPERVAYLTQTTLAVDETSGIVSHLRERFPQVVGPASDDICYATQNRQDAVRALARSCDLVLVVGSTNSSNSNRLVEVARRHGCPAQLVDDESEIDVAWLHGVRRLGLTAGASVPERIVQRVIKSLAVLGPSQVGVEAVAEEQVSFALPREVRE